MQTESDSLIGCRKPCEGGFMPHRQQSVSPACGLMTFPNTDMSGVMLWGLYNEAVLQTLLLISQV